jgi:Flp pilus assembly pilin Flp
MKNIKGNSLSQYAIIIALIALALVPAFFLLGKNIYGHFDLFYQLLAGKTANNADISTPEPDITDVKTPSSDTQSIAAGSLGGTPDNPVKNCDSGLCVIDFGNMILTGIPDNFSELVQTTGSSGGTEAILSIIDQIIDQLDSDVPAESRKNLEELADLGHILAAFERHVENIAEQCAQTSYPKDCFHNKICSKSTLEIDPELLKAFPTLNTTGMLGNLIVQSGRIGGAMHDYLLNTDFYDARVEKDLSFTFVERYNKVMQDEYISDMQKAIIKEMYWQIAILGEEIDAKLWGASGINETIIINDPITGDGVEIDVTGFTNEDIYKPGSSNITDLDSAIICATGNMSDTGTQCH